MVKPELFDQKPARLCIRWEMIYQLCEPRPIISSSSTSLGFFSRLISMGEMYSLLIFRARKLPGREPRCETTHSSPFAGRKPPPFPNFWGGTICSRVQPHPHQNWMRRGRERKGPLPETGVVCLPSPSTSSNYNIFGEGKIGDGLSNLTATLFLCKPTGWPRGQ